MEIKKLLQLLHDNGYNDLTICTIDACLLHALDTIQGKHGINPQESFTKEFGVMAVCEVKSWNLQRNQ